MAQDDAFRAKLLDRLERLPLFADINKPSLKKAREALTQFAKFETYAPGKTIIEQGSFAVEFGVLIDGLLGVQLVDPGGATRRLATMGPGDWFGEMTALSNQAASARVVAEQRCLVLHLDPPLFKAFYESAKGAGEFRRKIDEGYQARSLAGHLRTAPLFASLGNSELSAIAERAQLVMFDEGQEIASFGQPADSIFIVRTGAVTRLNPERDAEGKLIERRIHSYYRANSSFGEEALAPGDLTWSGTYTATAPTHVVKLPRSIFEAALPEVDMGGTDAMLRLRIMAQEMVVEESGSLGEIDLMAGKETVKGGRALVIDLSKCTRCNACVESCVAVHEDGVPRLSKKGNRIEPSAPGEPTRVLTSACYSCEIPDCMASCDFGAIRRDAGGSIDFVWDNCTGCGKCPLACPYDVIRMTPPPAEGDSRPEGWLTGLPLIGSWFRPSKKAAAQEGKGVETGERTGTRVIAKAIKCDLCEGLPYEACVYNCPCGAIDREDPFDLFAKDPKAGPL